MFNESGGGVEGLDDGHEILHGWNNQQGDGGRIHESIVRVTARGGVRNHADIFWNVEQRNEYYSRRKHPQQEWPKI